jgi:hypothetical protein
MTWYGLFTAYTVPDNDYRPSGPPTHDEGTPGVFGTMHHDCVSDLPDTQTKFQSRDYVAQKRDPRHTSRTPVGGYVHHRPVPIVATDPL